MYFDGLESISKVSDVIKLWVVNVEKWRSFPTNDGTLLGVLKHTKMLNYVKTFVTYIIPHTRK